MPVLDGCLIARELKSRRWSDEKEYFNGAIEFVWDGKTPEIDEEVLVYNPTTKRIITDTWVDYGEGIGFEDTDEDTVFWMRYPQPPMLEARDDNE